MTSLPPSLQIARSRLGRRCRTVFCLSQPIAAAALIGIGLSALPVGSVILPLVSVVAGVVWAVLMERMLYAAFYDALTGLPNRAYFLRQVERAMRQSKRQSYQYAVFWLDLDRFRSINDRLGQRAGNQLLQALSQRLLVAASPAVTLARVGGNEFALLWDNLQTPTQVIQIANHIQALLAAPFEVNGQPLHITISMGIVRSSTDYAWADDLLKDAQLATYHAKRLGRSRHAIFQPSLRVQAVPLLQLEADLRQAIERRELRLYYQAIVSLETGKITGFEALVRWQHPQFGLLLPTRFIRVAEDSGLIAAIGCWTLVEACCQLRDWQQRFPMETPLHISVNLSSRQLLQPDLVRQVEDVLKSTQLEAGTLNLEITESVMMEDGEVAIATLEQMRALNVRLSIDDFGTGYSSLNYLYRLPTDTLKIDRSFVNRIGNDSENDAIVRLIISLAHSLGMRVIAEGIETAAQLAFLRTLSCEHGQGYFFSKPVDRLEAEALLMAAPKW